MARIKLVQGDTRPALVVDILDCETWDPIDVSAASTTVTMKFFATGTDTVLTTITAAKLPGQLLPDGTVDATVTTPGQGGRVVFNWPAGALNVDPGYYDGEVEVNFGSETQTLYDRLKFTVRDQI